MNHNILIIEDEPEIANLTAFALKRDGLSVTHHTTATDGLAVAQTGQYALIILDVGLPDGDGFDVLKTLRQTSNVPVIMLTARNDEVDRILGLELGADDYVCKPFSPRELVARVKAILKRATPHTAPETGLHYDDSRQQIRYNGTPLPLTLAERKLLTHMMTHPQHVFSRDQLLTAIFSPNHPSDIRTIDTHIKTLRHKLRDVGMAEDTIKTHRAIGYSFG